MSVIKQSVGARNAFASSSLSTLVTGAYAVTDSSYNCNTTQPLDVIVELQATATSPAGNKQLVVFIQESLDGTNFRTGPTSGTSTVDEANLKFLGTLPMNTSAVTQRATFSVASVLGYVPFAFKVIVKNDISATLTNAALYTAEITSTVV